MEPIHYTMLFLLAMPVLVMVWAVSMMMIDDCFPPKGRNRRR